MIVDPEAPGRGPRWMGALYRWNRVDDLPLIGNFDGVVLGVRKGADTLIVGLPVGGYIGVRYEHLESAIRVEHCPKCKRTTLLRVTQTEWACDSCGFREVQELRSNAT